MHCLVEIAYEASAAKALQTLVLEAGEKFTTVMSGKKSNGCRFEGSWIALEGGIVYLVIESEDGAPVYEICHELRHCAPGIRVRVVPVLTAKAVGQMIQPC